MLRKSPHCFQIKWRGVFLSTLSEYTTSVHFFSQIHRAEAQYLFNSFKDCIDTECQTVNLIGNGNCISLLLTLKMPLALKGCFYQSVCCILPWYCLPRQHLVQTVLKFCLLGVDCKMLSVKKCHKINPTWEYFSCVFHGWKVGSTFLKRCFNWKIL